MESKRNNTFKQMMAIIILNYENYEITIKCVEQLLDIGVKHQIIIVDNYSSNNSFEILEEKYADVDNIKVVMTNRNGGYSYGNNYGIKEANRISNFSYYCIMNPDVRIEENFFEYLCETLSQKKEYAIISPMMFYKDCLDLTKISWNPRTEKEIYRHHFLLNRETEHKCRHKYKSIGKGLIETEVVPGSCFIVDAEIFNSIGNFDENCFLYNEETIVGLKLKKINKKCLIDTSHFFIHEHEYKKEAEEVWESYRNDFSMVLNNYKITYESRKYLCEVYYNGRYLTRLRIVKFLNIILLYIKHFIAVFFK